MASQGTDPTGDAETKTIDPVPRPSLQDRIQTLTDVHNRLKALRHVPTMLLRPPSASGLGDFPAPFDATMDREFAATFNSTPAHDLRGLKEFLDTVCSDQVQEALRAARESEDADSSELGLTFRRENRKRKRPQSPVGSPQPYVPSPPRSSSLFACAEDEPPTMRAEGLIEYVREFNRAPVGELKTTTATEGEGPASRCRVAIWSRTEKIRDDVKAKDGSLTSPVVLRFVIPDVLMAYISVMFARMEDPVVVESVAAFGPRERKLPHEQSEYMTFQGLSEHMTKMILSHPRVPVQILMNMLVSYRGLFVERCAGCERVLSAEGHIPPVARRWVQEVDRGRWEARHGSCLYP